MTTYNKLRNLLCDLRQVLLEGLVLPPCPPLPDPVPLDYETALSFDEWKAMGYRIKKGSKCELRDALGIPQFCIEQVQKQNYG